MAEVGVSIQHDANHGAYCGNSALGYMLGITLDIVGASSFMWKQQHVVGHHTYTNVDGLDPDIRVKDPDVRRVSQHQPWQSYQVRLHYCLQDMQGIHPLPYKSACYTIRPQELSKASFEAAFCADSDLAQLDQLTEPTA